MEDTEPQKKKRRKATTSGRAFAQPATQPVQEAEWVTRSTKRGESTKHYGRRTEIPSGQTEVPTPVPILPPSGPLPQSKTSPDTASPSGGNADEFKHADFTYQLGDTTEGITQNDYLREFIALRQQISARILRNEGLPLDRICKNCGMTFARWRCLDCAPSTFCRRCCREKHAAHPYHQLQCWNGSFWQTAAASEVGIKLYLGHDGLKCPSIQIPRNPNTGEIIEDKQRHLDSQDAALAEDLLTHGRSRGKGKAKESGPMLLATMDALGDETGMEEDPEENGNSWEDIEEERAVSDARFCPLLDEESYPFVIVVHCTGLVALPMVACECPHSDMLDTLLDQRLFPASFKQPRTLFTFTVLQDFRLSNLEAKTSAYQYFMKLRRMTNSGFPHLVPNRYAELRRVSRQWRNLNYLRWNGFGYRKDDPSDEVGSGDTGGILSTPKPGELGLFCPACPQPGLNMPTDWKTRYTRDEVMRTLVVDGNFTADHLRQKRAHDDVWLMEGQAMTTARQPYQSHLKVAIETREKDHCDNSFKALLNANSGDSTHKDVTGIVGHACGRHGCYVPRSVVDLQKGERQANVDWSLRECLSGMNLNGIDKILHIYDIACQYHKKLVLRVNRNPILKFPIEDLTIDRAVGSFHVHGHNEDCFHRYATLFIPGAGMIDGEIMETLWSVLNHTSRSIRTATLAHRAEVLDDHMGHSNWKKLIGIVARIIQKYNRAVDNNKRSDFYFSELSKAAPKHSVPTWEASIRSVEEVRIVTPIAMDIMKPRIPKVQGLADIAAEVLDEGLRGISVQVSWIRSGFRIQESQAKLAYIVRKAGRRPSLEDRTNISKQRDALVKTISKFATAAERILGRLAISGWEDREEPDDPLAEPVEMEDSDGEDLPPIRDFTPHPEAASIPLPSMFPSSQWVNFDAEDIQLVELRLRKGLSQDILKTLRSLVGQKSLVYSQHVRKAGTKRYATRSKDTVRQVEQSIDHNKRLYNTNRSALMRLGLTDEEATTGRHRPLTKKDLDASAALENPNKRGESRRQLSWIWTVDLDPDAAHNKDYLTEFFRINWLRARAQAHRWREELTLVRNEMEWVVRFFHTRAIRWGSWANDQDITDGHRAYAKRQEDMWERFESSAFQRFQAINPDIVVIY